MANKIDRELLLQNMLAAPDVTFLSENLRYLMDAIITPMLNDQTVALSSLDFDRFEEDDLDRLEKYVAMKVGKDNRLPPLSFQIRKLSPSCVHQSVFC